MQSASTELDPSIEIYSPEFDDFTTLESPKGGVRAAGTSENEVRFGISVCAAKSGDAALEQRPHALRKTEGIECASVSILHDAVQAKYFRNNGLSQRRQTEGYSVQSPNFAGACRNSSVTIWQSLEVPAR